MVVLVAPTCLDRGSQVRKPRGVILTVGVAWISKTGRSDRLWIASDSRLSGDTTIWDECPKILALPRRDAALAFSGSTSQAYPLMLQMSNSVLGHRPAMDGSLELNLLLEHLQRVANSLLENLQVDSGIRGSVATEYFKSFDDMVMAAGFSRQNGLVIRTLRYEPTVAQWKFAKVRSQTRIGPNKPFHIFGDKTARHRYHSLFEERLKKAKKLKTEKPLELEPLEVLWDFVKLPESTDEPLPAGHRPRSIGGEVQVMQITAGAQTTPLAVRRSIGGTTQTSLLGRKLLSGENVQTPLVEETGGVQRLTVSATDQWTP